MILAPVVFFGESAARLFLWSLAYSVSTMNVYNKLVLKIKTEDPFFFLVNLSKNPSMQIYMTFAWLLSDLCFSEQMRCIFHSTTCPLVRLDNLDAVPSPLDNLSARRQDEKSTFIDMFSPKLAGWLNNLARFLSWDPCITPGY